jgi:hypothetical protein
LRATAPLFWWCSCRGRGQIDETALSAFFLATFAGFFALTLSVSATPALAPLLADDQVQMGFGNLFSSNNNRMGFESPQFDVAVDSSPERC